MVQLGGAPYVTDAGDLLPHRWLVAPASTTREQAAAAALSETYDSEQRITEILEAQGPRARAARQPGSTIMELLGIGPGREVGESLGGSSRTCSGSSADRWIDEAEAELRLVGAAAQPVVPCGGTDPRAA